MLPDGYEAIIGLECHAQLQTKSKMFCGCPVTSEAPPNAAICPTCMGHPGTLPVINAAAVALGVRAALALSCTLHPESIFARKHYFYPDLPKGYQISQYDRPLATGGKVHTPLGDFSLTRIHLEEDAGKMLHGGRDTVVDWNRAGVPLIEIVSEAEMRTPEEAEAYLKTLHRVLVEGGICTGDMEKGHFRCDVNLSVHRVGEPWGTKVEVKNVNSFRFVGKAIRYEIDRQMAMVTRGERIPQETRTWGGAGTVALRKKEGSADYRYFPEPDLGPLHLSEATISRETAALPGIPFDLHLQAADRALVEEWVGRYGLTPYDVGVLTGEETLRSWFLEAVALGGPPKAMSGWVQGEVSRRFKEGESEAAGLGKLRPKHLVEVQALLDAGTVNRDGARKLLAAAAETGASPKEGAAGVAVVGDEAALSAVIGELLQKFPSELGKYRAGNRGMLGFFMGKLMAATGRRADPATCTRLLEAALREPE